MVKYYIIIVVLLAVVSSFVPDHLDFNIHNTYFTIGDNNFRFMTLTVISFIKGFILSFVSKKNHPLFTKLFTIDLIVYILGIILIVGGILYSLYEFIADSQIRSGAESFSGLYLYYLGLIVFVASLLYFLSCTIYVFQVTRKK